MKNDLLRLAREQKGWTQLQLAEKLSIAGSTLRSWENGQRTPSTKQRLHLCDLFGLTAAQLGLEQDAEASHDEE